MSTNSATWPTEIADESDWDVYLELQKNEETGTYLGPNDAVATGTLYTLADVPVPGGEQIALTCISAATGRWRGRIPYTASAVVGTTYKLVITITATAGPRRVYTVWVVVVEAGG